MSETRRPRRPSEGGYARGDETRQRIIAAAIELFGEKGFTAASTRDIAAAAGVNAPALQYYFENKEGVFRACAEFISDEIWAAFGPVVQEGQQLLDDNAGVSELIDVFIRIQEAMADHIFTVPNAASRKLFFMREQQGHEPQIGTQIMQERVRGPLNHVTGGLLARISGTPADDQVTLIRLITLFGQMSLFNISPRSVLCLLGWKEVDAEKRELLKATIGAQTRTLLQSWHDEYRKRLSNEKSGKNGTGAAKIASASASALKPRAAAKAKAKPQNR